MGIGDMGSHREMGNMTVVESNECTLHSEWAVPEDSGLFVLCDIL